MLPDVIGTLDNSLLVARRPLSQLETQCAFLLLPLMLSTTNRHIVPRAN